MNRKAARQKRFSTLQCERRIAEKLVKLTNICERLMDWQKTLEARELALVPTKATMPVTAEEISAFNEDMETVRLHDVA